MFLASNVGNTLVGIPVGFVGKSFINTIVEVLVMREDDMATDVVKLITSQFR